MQSHRLIFANAAGEQLSARLGDRWYINPHNRIDTLERQIEIYKQALDEVGK